jgi:S1-C subfamily serine protease
LAAPERDRLQRLIGLFLATMGWEGAQGFEVTEEMRVLVAAQACLLLLGLEIDEYPATDSVIVHPGTVRLRGEHHLGGGLRSNGVMAVDGQALKRSGERGPNAQLVEFMRSVEPGRVVKVDYLREGQRRSASVTAAPAAPPMMRVLSERLAGPLAEGLALPGLEGLLGPERGLRSLELVPLTPKLGQYFGTDRGLLVVRAADAPGLPLEEGDVLQTIDGRTPESPGHAFRILRSYQPGEKVRLGVLRQRKPLTLEATLPAADALREGRQHRRSPAPLVPPAPPAPPPASGSA